MIGRINKKIFGFLLLFGALLSVSSCNDSGCVEADDFGEYQSQTLIVKASDTADSCTYDTVHRENLNHNDHGSGLRTCFTSSNITINDASGARHTSTAGCQYWQPTTSTGAVNSNVNLPVMNLCVSQCIDQCNIRVMMGSNNPNPDWVSTDTRAGNGEVTLKPGAEISVRATGTITLGGEQELTELYIHPNVDAFLPTTKNATGGEIYQKVSSGDVVGLKFSGGFVDGDNVLGSSTVRVGNVGLMNVTNQPSLESYFSANAGKRADLINAMNRVVMFVEADPVGYSYGGVSGAVYNRADVSGIPERPYHEAWACTYSGTNPYQNSCQNDISAYMTRYTGLGSTAAVTTAINNIYPISSTTRTGTNFSSNGGILKISSDHTNFRDHVTYNPFDVSTCPSQFDCSGVGAATGAIAGDLSSGSQVVPISRSSQVYFKYLQSSCASQINVKVKSSRTAATDLYTHNSITVTNGWTNGGQHVSVQSGQFLEIERVAGSSSTTFIGPSGSVDCGRALAVKYVPYFDFPIDKSGLVSFANLGAVTATGNCNLKFRIINPNGSHSSYSLPTNMISAYSTGSLTSIDADFYEYGDFNQTTVPEESSNIKTVDSAWNTNLNEKIYVRKGQVIRFAPESWSGTWSPVTGLTRQCGVGMAVRIEPRPALLCRGQGAASVRNPSCTPNVVSGNVRGCSAISPTCNSSTGGAFCPDTRNCVGAITFTEPTDEISPRTSGVVTRITFPTSGTAMQNHACGFVYTTSGSGSSMTRTGIDAAKRTQCERCQDAMKAAGEQSPYITENDVQNCYNLENYTGKVANITNDYAKFFNTLPAPSVAHTSVTKGMTKLGRFNGTIGNLGNYGAASDGEALVPTMLNHYFQASGRLKLMILDGSDFKPSTISAAYTNNGVANGPVTYSTSAHNNGFKVKLSNFLEFGNGENLEVLFCKESSSTSNLCRSLNRRTATYANVPDIQDLGPSVTNSFSFDEHGNLYRSSGIRAGKKNCDGVSAGDKYFCHCRGDYSAANAPQGCTGAASDGDSSTCTSVNNCLYRLTFKIRDPEEANCAIPIAADNTATSYDERTSYTCDNDATTATPACNGIKTANSGYISTITTAGVSTPATANVGQICSYADLNPTGSGATPCAKQFICTSKYSNNTGQYNVVVRVKNRNNRVSGLVSSLINPVLRVMDGYTDSSGRRVPGQSERLYKLIIADPAYVLILKLCLILMISFYGLTFLMGLNDGGTADIISKVVKIGLILFFVSEQGWDWFYNFVVATFKHGTDELTFLVATSFDNSPVLRDAIANNVYTDKSILFSSVDKVMGLFFASAVQKKISALLFSGLFGWLYILIIYYAIIAYIFAVSTAVLVYLTAQVFISILFVLGPIFFIFTLFEKTKEMFDKWLQQLIGFSLQQVFLLITLSFFNMMMYEIVKNSLGYRVCWDEVWTINIIIRISLMSFWTIPNIPPLFESQAEMGSSGRGEGVPSFFSILFIWMVAKLMDEFITFMSNVAADIGGGISATALASGVMGDVKGARQFVGKQIGKAYDRSIGFGVRRLDHVLFDSGIDAKRARKAKRQQDSMDLKNKSAMVKAGRKGVNEFKKNHGAELAGMSKEEQQKKLNEVRDQAMDKKGKKLGLNDDDIKRLKNDKGVKYRGDHLAGYIAKAAYQRSRRGGSTLSSITSKDVDKDLTKRQARKALKNTDAEGRKKMIDAVKKGDIYVESGGGTSYLPGGKKIAALKKSLSSSVNLPKVFESKAHAQARRELESEGKIDKMRAGHLNYVLRKDEENKMIRERMSKNRIKVEEGKMNKRSKASTVASLEMESDYQDAKQNVDAENRSDHVMKGPMGMELRKRGKFKEHGEKKKAVQQGRLQSIRAELEEKHDKMKGLVEEKEGEIDNIDAQIDELQQDPVVADHESLRKELGQVKGSYNPIKAFRAGTKRRMIKGQMELLQQNASKESKAKIALLEDKKSERQKLSHEKAHMGEAGALDTLGRDIESIKEMEALEQGADAIIAGSDEGGKYADRPELVKKARAAKKDVEEFKAGRIGVEGGRSIATLGFSKKSTDDSMAKMKNKYKDVTDATKEPEKPTVERADVTPAPTRPDSPAGGPPPTRDGDEPLATIPEGDESDGGETPVVPDDVDHPPTFPPPPPPGDDGAPPAPAAPPPGSSEDDADI